MTILGWGLIGVFVLNGVVGGIFQALMMGELKRPGLASFMSGSWVLDAQTLHPRGRVYRRAVLLCWAVAGALSAVIYLWQ